MAGLPGDAAPRWSATGGRGSGRLSPKCTLYWVRNVLDWLAEQGMARSDGGPGPRAWMLTERFRVQVKDMAASRPTGSWRLGRGEDPTAGLAPATPEAEDTDQETHQETDQATDDRAEDE